MKTNKIMSMNSSVLTVVTIALLGIVIYVGNIIIVNTSKITDIICLIAFTIMPTSSIVCVMCFLIPLASGITKYYIYGYAVLMLLLKSKRHKMQVYLPLIIIMVFELLMMLLFENYIYKNVLVYLLTMFLLFYMINDEETNPKYACISYVCGTIIMLLCIFTTAVQNYSLEMVLTGSVRIGAYDEVENIGSVAAISENANAMAYYALIAIVVSFTLLSNAKTLGKVTLIIAMVFSAVIALFTVSRTFIIVLIILSVLALLSSGKFKQKLKFLLAIVIVLAIVIPYIQQETQLFEAFTMRFEEEGLLTGSGRTNIFSEYMEFLFNNPLHLMFGTGAVFYREVCKLSYSMHNGLQQILVAYGLLGFVPMLIALINPIVKFFKKNKFKLIKILPILAVFMFIQTIQFLNPYNLVLPYAIAVLCMKIPNKEASQ